MKLKMKIKQYLNQSRDWIKEHKNISVPIGITSLVGAGLITGYFLFRCPLEKSFEKQTPKIGVLEKKCQDDPKEKTPQTKEKEEHQYTPKTKEKDKDRYAGGKDFSRRNSSKDKNDYVPQGKDSSKKNYVPKTKDKSESKDTKKSKDNVKETSTEYTLKEMPGVWINIGSQNEYNELMKVYENASNIYKEECCGTQKGWAWKNKSKATKLNVYDGDTFVQIKNKFSQANKKDLIKYSPCNDKIEYKQKVISLDDFLKYQGLK